MRLLDRELRLITPTDPEGSDRPSGDTDDSCYQLAHDYLVPSLRDWLTRKQKETRRGRAELRQEELAALWNAKPENQRLPTFRLPTNAEWEFACRAGSVTSRFFGESPELLPEYAWSSQDRPERILPVGLLKPNDFGLFDMYGNLNEWRADVVDKYQVAIGGGSFGSHASQMTSSDYGGAVPSTRYNSYGMRVVRTRKTAK